jgi:hypothetical protein
MSVEPSSSLVLRSIVLERSSFVGLPNRMDHTWHAGNYLLPFTVLSVLLGLFDSLFLLFLGLAFERLKIGWY